MAYLQIGRPARFQLGVTKEFSGKSFLVALRTELQPSPDLEIIYNHTRENGILWLFFFFWIFASTQKLPKGYPKHSGAVPVIFDGPSHTSKTVSATQAPWLGKAIYNRTRENGI